MHQPFHFEQSIFDPENFLELNERLILPPTVALPFQGQQYILHTDACE